MRLTGEAGVDAFSDATGVVGVDETGNACCRTFDETVVVGVAGAGPFALGGDALIVMLGIMRFVTPCFASKIRYHVSRKVLTIQGRKTHLTVDDCGKLYSSLLSTFHSAQSPLQFGR
jgi:threonine dehydrogenase-like Zn-dependent dehydrogenase